LTDRSPDFWKTMRVWAEQVRVDEALPDSTLFILITTAIASPGSAASLLRETGRNVSEAERRLDKIVIERPSDTNKEGYAAWHALSKPIRARLLAAIRIIDGSEHNVDITAALEHELHWAARDKALRELVVRHIEGWWNNRLAYHLQHQEDRITVDELDERIHAFAETLRPDSLPIPSGIEDITATLSGDEEGRKLVRQLRLLNYGDSVILRALTDFYKAETLIAEAMRERLYFLNDLKNYHNLLHDEWLQRFVLLKDDLKSISDEDAIIIAGRRLYSEIMALAIPIRQNRKEPYIMRGTYHALADVPRVGWHPNYMDHIS